MVARGPRVRKSVLDRLGDLAMATVLTLSVLVTLYPFVYVLSMSISSPEYAATQKVWLWPMGFSIESYRMVFRDQMIWRAYYNTIWYTVVGTLVNVTMTTVGAYALSRREFFARNFFMVFIAVTMFFSGGLIPLFILVNKLGLYNTRWAIVLPVAVNAWYLIIARVYLQSNIPDSLPESAKMDGCTDLGILARIVVPLSAPIIAVISLFSAVGFWNSYFTAIIYLPDIKLQPLTVLLQKILIESDTTQTVGLRDQEAQRMYAVQIKYSIIIITILPIICLYPFLQKYFVKGVMIGAIKG